MKIHPAQRRAAFSIGVKKILQAGLQIARFFSSFFQDRAVDFCPMDPVQAEKTRLFLRKEGKNVMIFGRISPLKMAMQRFSSQNQWIGRQRPVFCNYFIMSAQLAIEHAP